MRIWNARLRTAMESAATSTGSRAYVKNREKEGDFKILFKHLKNTVILFS